MVTETSKPLVVKAAKTVPGRKTTELTSAKVSVISGSSRAMSSQTVIGKNSNSTSVEDCDEEEVDSASNLR